MIEMFRPRLMGLYSSLVSVNLKAVLVGTEVLFFIPGHKSFFGN